MNEFDSDPFKLIEELTEIGIALSAERDHDRLLEMILQQAERITAADGGTLYLYSDDDTLRFEIVHTESLGIRMGGTSGTPITFPPIALHDNAGNPNHKMVAAHCALSGETINIEDAYSNSLFDFSGTQQFDRSTGYRSQSFLTVPMRNHEGELIGVLQLLNARDPASRQVRPFTVLDQKLVESLASQAAVSITNKSLIDAQRELFDSFIRLIANAIDEKSPYTAGHCRRVPVLTDLLADAACRTADGPLSEFSMSADERYELSVAAWLHDCGKITTPEYVVDKSTKLETIFDRIELVEARMEALRQRERAEALARALTAEGKDPQAVLHADARYRPVIDSIDDELAFLQKANIGGEFIDDADRRRITEIAGRRWRDAEGDEGALLTEEEVHNLHIGRGTLTAEERDIIANHVVVTIKMLESLPYPKHLRRVPEYAGGHHERLDGTGYPQGLTSEQMSIPARMVAIADIFEALTAADRPYKRPMQLSQALTILGRMAIDNHIDRDLFQVFVDEQVYRRYAEEFLDASQLDDVDLASIPGYQARAAG